MSQRRRQGAPGSDWQGTPSLFPSSRCLSSAGPPAAMKKAFADAQSSKSPQFLSGPNGSNPLSTVAVAVGAAVVGVAVAVGSTGEGDAVGNGVRAIDAVGVGPAVGAGDGVRTVVEIEVAIITGVLAGSAGGVESGAGEVAGARGGSVGAIGAVGTGSACGVEIGVDVSWSAGFAAATVATITEVGCWAGDILVVLESPVRPEPGAVGAEVLPAPFVCSGTGVVGVGVAVTTTVT